MRPEVSNTSNLKYLQKYLYIAPSINRLSIILQVTYPPWNVLDLAKGPLEWTKLHV